MFKCKYCKDTGMVPLLNFSKPCLDCPKDVPPPDAEGIWCKCNKCGSEVKIMPGTWGYESLMWTRKKILRWQNDITVDVAFVAKFTKPAIMGKFLVYPYNDMNEKDG